MATYQILYWQEIPSLVEARDSDGVKKVQLSDKFQSLIDEAAMRRDLPERTLILRSGTRGRKPRRMAPPLRSCRRSPMKSRLVFQKFVTARWPSPIKRK